MGIKTLSLINKYIKTVFPMVEKELQRYKKLLENCPNKTLQKQGLLSIEKKSFHAIGGSIFAIYPNVDTPTMVRFITAFQTISDYLDNLCDNTGLTDEKSFRQLHLSMIDAVDIQKTTSDYYKYYPFQDDGGYLITLVNQCRNILPLLPNYKLVKNEMINLVQLYCDLQVYKHLDVNHREDKLQKWAYKNNPFRDLIYHWEFSAACGSTLCIFYLLVLSSQFSTNPKMVNQGVQAYFPWVCGLHILLDYFIDRQEDLEENELNFTSYYKNNQEMYERLKFFLSKSQQYVRILDNTYFHQAVIKGLLAMYLSDKKTSLQAGYISSGLLQESGLETTFLHKICSLLRAKGKL